MWRKIPCSNYQNVRKLEIFKESYWEIVLIINSFELSDIPENVSEGL